MTNGAQIDDLSCVLSRLALDLDEKRGRHVLDQTLVPRFAQIDARFGLIRVGSKLIVHYSHQKICLIKASQTNSAYDS